MPRSRISVVADRIVVAVGIPNLALSAELLMIAPPQVGCASIICPPTRFVICVLNAVTGSTRCDAT